MKRIVLITLIAVSYGLTGCEAAVGCNFQAYSAELRAEAMERNPPLSVSRRIAALHSRATSHQLRGEFRQACEKLDEAFEILERY